jgi:flap endonuclease-1
MGIKGLNKLLKEQCKTGIQEIYIKDLKGKVVAIDTSIYLYKYTFMGDLIKHFIFQIIHLLKNNIIPVYLFDGKPTDEKSNLMKERKEKLKQKEDNVTDMKEKRDSLQIQLDELKNNPEKCEEILDKIIQINNELTDLTICIKKKEKTCIKISWEDVAILKQILEECNILAFQCNGETDIFVKDFFKKGLVDYALTEDLDFLTHHCPKVLYGYNYKSSKINCYNLDIIVEELELTKDSFIDLCILLGCDYTSTIKKIGLKTAYKLIKEYKNIENILKQIQTNKKFKKYEPKNDFDHLKARNMFNMICDVDVSKKDIQIEKKEKYDKLVTILQCKNIKGKYIEELIKIFSKLQKPKKKAKNIMLFMKKK